LKSNLSRASAGVGVLSFFAAGLKRQLSIAATKAWPNAGSVAEMTFVSTTRPV